MNGMESRTIACGVLLIVAALPLASFGQDFSLKVKPEPQRSTKVLELHLLLAERLTATKMRPPAARIQYYLSVNQPGFPPIIGWHGRITKAEPVPGGFVATVRVSAKFDGCVDSLYILERYFVTKQGVSFLGVDSPPPSRSRMLFGF